MMDRPMVRFVGSLGRFFVRRGAKTRPGARGSGAGEREGPGSFGQFSFSEYFWHRGFWFPSSRNTETLSAPAVFSLT